MQYNKKQHILKDENFDVEFKLYREYIEVFMNSELIHTIELSKKGTIKTKKEKEKCIDALKNKGFDKQYAEEKIKELTEMMDKIMKKTLRIKFQYDPDSEIHTDKNTNIGYKIKKQIIEIYKGKKLITIVKLNNKGTIKSQKTIDEAIDDVFSADDFVPHEYVKKFMKKIDIELNIKNENLIEEMEEQQNSDVFFLLELQDSPSNSRALSELGRYMSEKYSIIQTDEGKHFYIDPKRRYYKPLSSIEYQYMISETLDLRLAAKYAKESLSTISGIHKEDYQRWEFADCHYYDPRKEEIIKLDEPIITSRKFINEELLTEYDPDVKYFNENPTFIEKTLREILIPMHDQEDDKLYKDFLYYLGLGLYMGNPRKLCVIYQGDGNDGKSTLSTIIYALFKDAACFKPAANELKDNFFLTRADGKNVTLIDEIKRDDLKPVEDIIKVLTGGVDVHIRKMHNDGIPKSLGYGLLFVFTNPIPSFTIEKSILNRIDIIQLPNIFEDEDDADYDPNIHYPINSNIRMDILEDYEGLKWLANVIIKAVKEYDYRKQDNTITKSILLGDDKLRKWIGEHLTIDQGGYISNSEIKNRVIDDDGFVGYDIDTLPQRIGYVLKDLFGDSLEKIGTYPANYNLRWLREGEV